MSDKGRHTKAQDRVKSQQSPGVGKGYRRAQVGSRLFYLMRHSIWVPARGQRSRGYMCTEWIITERYPDGSYLATVEAKPTTIATAEEVIARCLRGEVRLVREDI